MPTNITEVSSYNATVAYPLNTELADESSMKDNFIQALTNRTKFLKAQIDGHADGTIPFTNLTVSNEAIIDDIECETLLVTTSATIGNNALDSHSVLGLLLCQHALQTNGTFVCIGQSEFNDPITLQGDGRLRYRPPTINSTGLNATYSIVTSDVVMLGEGVTLAADRVWIITNTGAAEGDHMVVSRRNYTSAFTVTLQRDDATQICNLLPSIHTAELYFAEGKWQAISAPVS